MNNQRLVSAYRYVFLGCAILALLCFSAMLIGRIQPQPQIPSLNLCGARPCYLGIIVGDTTWDEARQIISAQGLALETNTLRGAKGKTGPFDYIRMYPNVQGVVIDMALSAHQPIAPVGDIINQLGAPCAVYSLADSSGNLLILSYPDHLQISARPIGWQLFPNSPVGKIELYPAHPLLNCDRPDGFRSYWQGFRAYPPLP
jgi:hypothetical protein